MGKQYSIKSRLDMGGSPATEVCSRTEWTEEIALFLRTVHIDNAYNNVWVTMEFIIKYTYIGM